MSLLIGFNYSRHCDYWLPPLHGSEIYNFRKGYKAILRQWEPQWELLSPNGDN